MRLFDITWLFNLKDVKAYNKMFPKTPCKLKIEFGRCGMLVMFPVNLDVYGKILDIYGVDLLWKDKDDEPRYEYYPFITITFFRKWQIAFKWLIDTSRYPKNSYEHMQDYWWEKYLWKKYYDKKSQIL